MAFRVGHNRCVYKSQIEIRVLGVELDRAPHQPGCQECGLVVSLLESREKHATRIAAVPPPKEHVRLGSDDIKDDQLFAKGFE